MPLKSWSVTCIEFEEGDLFSFVVAFSQLTPVFVCVALATLCAFQRDLRVAVFFVGQLFDAAFNQVLKRIIKQPRPNSTANASLRTDYGMPSNHSEFVLFFATYVALIILFRCKFEHKFWKAPLVAGLYFLALVVSYSRLLFTHHTFEQVAVGAVVGFFMANVWFALDTYVFGPYVYPIIEEWRVAKYLYVKDSGKIDNLLKWEWEECRKRGASNKKRGGTDQAPAAKKETGGDKGGKKQKETKKSK